MPPGSLTLSRQRIEEEAGEAGIGGVDMTKDGARQRLSDPPLHPTFSEPGRPQASLSDEVPGKFCLRIFVFYMET